MGYGIARNILGGLLVPRKEKFPTVTSGRQAPDNVGSRNVITTGTVVRITERHQPVQYSHFMGVNTKALQGKTVVNIAQ